MARSLLHRKGFFFTADVFIAISFLVIGFLFVYSAYIKTPATSQSVYYSNDLISFFSKTKVSEVDSIDVFKLWCDACVGATHNITNPQKTLLEQMITFAYANKTGLAEVISNTSRGIIRPHYSYRINITLESQSWIVSHNERSPFESSELVLASSDVSYILLNDTELAGPFITRVEVWT